MAEVALFNNFYNCDCQEYMNTISDNFFELAIVDPPYGIGFDGGYEQTKGKSLKSHTFNREKILYQKKEWDNYVPDQNYFDELLRISKNQIIWGGNYFTDKLPVSRGWIYWDKKISSKGNKNFSDGELAWTSFNCILKKFTFDWIGFGYLNSKNIEDRKSHPTQKPVALYKWLLQNYAQKKDKIFDSHVGSGSSIIACIEEKFEYIGCELDTDYYNKAIERIRLHFDRNNFLKEKKEMIKKNNSFFEKIK